MLNFAPTIRSQAERSRQNHELGIAEKPEIKNCQRYLGTQPLRTIDLNLFRVFDAIMEHRSVCKASQTLCITPSAVSHALNRLRQSIGDELFVPSQSGMQPTRRSLELSAVVREGFERLESALS
jgi:hypothetical protein